MIDTKMITNERAVSLRTLPTCSHCDAILSLDPNDLEQLYVARDQRSAPYHNAFGIGGGRNRGGGRTRGRGGLGSGRGAFGRGPGGPPPPKVATPRMIRTSRPIERITTERVGTTDCRDNPLSTTTELTHLIAGKLPSTKSTTTCAPTVSAAKSMELAIAPKTPRHANSVRRQCLRRLGGKQGSKFSRMFELKKTLAQRGIDNPIEAPQLCSRIVKIIDQLYLGCDDSFSEQG